MLAVEVFELIKGCKMLLVGVESHLHGESSCVSSLLKTLLRTCRFWGKVFSLSFLSFVMGSLISYLSFEVQSYIYERLLNFEPQI